MTTIAWDGRYLAADSLATSHRRKFYNVEKIVIADNNLLAVAGNAEYKEMLTSWLAMEPAINGFDEPRPNAVDFEAFLFSDGIAYEFYDSFTLQKVDEPTAYGSGAVYAETALFLGKNAMQAVHTATCLDAFSGGHVVYVDTRAKVMKIKRWEKKGG